MSGCAGLWRNGIFPDGKTPSNRVLLEWAQGYFGRYAGYANQYLFHGRRLRDRKLQGDGR